MLTIKKNNNTKIVTKGAYKEFYEHLGYEIVDNKKPFEKKIEKEIETKVEKDSDKELEKENKKEDKDKNKLENYSRK